LTISAHPGTSLSEVFVSKSSRGQRGTLGPDFDGRQNEALRLAVAVAQFRFPEWTPNVLLRHASFVAIREDKRTAR